MTREQLMARAAAQQLRDHADQLELNMQARERYAAVVAATIDPTLRAVVNLHEPHDATRVDESGPTCHGCDPGDYADSHARWPCATFTTVEGGVARDTA